MRTGALLLELSSVFALARTVTAALNATIDDSYGDSRTGFLPEYQPIDAWQTGHNCSSCGNTPDDRTQIHNGTWHYATSTTVSRPNVTVNFQGTAVYAYGILQSMVGPSSSSGPPPWVNASSPPPWVTAAMTNFTITLDGMPVEPFVASPSTSFRYNVLLYANTALPNGNHALSITAGFNPSTGASSVMLFDYVDYTYNSPTPTSSTSSTMELPIPTTVPVEAARKISGGIIAGGIVGGIAALLLLAFLALFCFRRRRRQARVHVQRAARPFVSVTISRLTDRPPSPPLSEKRAYYLSEDRYFTSPISLIRSPTRSSHTMLTAPSRGAPTLTIPRGRSGTMSTAPLTSAPSEALTELGVQRQIDAIHLEIERLRTEHAEAHASIGLPPPAYHPPQDRV